MAGRGRQYVKDFYDYFSGESDEEANVPTQYEYRRSAKPTQVRGKQNMNKNRNFNRGRSQNRSRGAKNKSYSPYRYAEKGQKVLQEIDRAQLIYLESRDPEDITIFFSKNNYAFEKLLSDETDFNKIVLFLRVLSKLCASSFREYKSKIINQISKRDFLQKLQNHISYIHTQEEREKRGNYFFWEHQKRFWDDLIILYNTVFYINPKTASAKLPRLIESNIRAVKKIYGTNFEHITQQFECLRLKLEAEQLKKDSFRHMSIYPDIREITSRYNPKIEALKQEGGYGSVEKYLDIHFRLYREDYLRSIRNGICTYLESRNTYPKIKQNDVRIYENVKFIRPHVTKDRVGILVQYPQPVKEISIESKLFMYGSLVCFTKDDFQNVVYGTVVESDTDLLLAGFVVVDIQDSILYGENYLMVEIIIHFETYYHVLKALQNMRDENFPMKNYLINISPEVKPPAYLNDKTKITIFPKKAKVDKKDEVIVNGMPIKSFRMLSKDAWPPKEYFKLNSSQFTAFKAALTSEFSVIQGPPGTGKTYTTHKIVEFLLKNKNSLQYSGSILVLCYTNHALDQFLEGILPFCNDIVRVGSQSKNAKMDEFNLRHHRRKIENDRDSYCKELFEAEREKYDQCVQKLQCLQNLLEDITCKTGILDFQLFKTIDDKLENSWFDQNGAEGNISWLMSDFKMRPGSTYQGVSFAYPKEVIQKPPSKDEKLETKIIDQTETYDSETDFVDNCILTLTKLDTQIQEIRTSAAIDYRKIQELERKKEYLEWRLNQNGINFNLLQKVDYKYPYNISPNERWELYRSWVHRLHLQAYEDISILDEEYRTAKRRYQEVQQMIDVHIMQDKSVIGITTTNAARLQPVLQALKCEIVIVEEAAEILESHIVAALTNYCQHLILIGDHLQLRPNTAQYDLAINYNLEISLFERMINNKIHYYLLDTQHRMRPEFAKLIVPSIYKYLNNNENVMSYPPVLGVAKNLFFITHNHLEERLRDTTSHKNIYEVHYLLKFASYLTKQGYTSEEITILTTYLGQLGLFLKECAQYPELENIRMSSVDNFQGEENKIILLSLVRNNQNENIGFLKIENRVCVALSRAKEGLYMIGNMRNLEKDSIIWPKIISTLTEDNSIGPYLPLSCQFHKSITQIEHYNDFSNIREGGCRLLCDKLLKCGHRCRFICHISDRNHELYICEEKCKKTICYRNHFCPNRCSDKCADYCSVIVEKFPKCGHKTNMECSKDISLHICTERCIKKLICGHEQIVTCSEDISKVKCTKKVSKKLSCEHIQVVACGEDISKIECIEAVNRKLNCEHIQMVPCGADISKVKCRNVCNNMLRCTHICKRICHLDDDPFHLKHTCQEPCKKIKLNCSTQTHMCTNKCFMPCENCREIVLKRRTLCRHEHFVPCCVNVNKIECEKDCGKIMQCGHFCHNKCNVPCGNCQIMCDKTLPSCGHKVTVQCGLVPQTYMCRGKCPKILNCGHNCKKRCNEECVCSKCNKCVIQ